MEDFAATNGASFRMVLDVGDWDNSLVINSPGQSGDPASPHYGDLFPLWAEGRIRPPALFARGGREGRAAGDHADAIGEVRRGRPDRQKTALAAEPLPWDPTVSGPR